MTDAQQAPTPETADPDEVLHHISVADVERLFGMVLTEEAAQFVKTQLAAALSSALATLAGEDSEEHVLLVGALPHDVHIAAGGRREWCTQVLRERVLPAAPNGKWADARILRVVDRYENPHYED